MSGPRQRRVIGASAPGKVEFAREQRREPTPGEALLWQALRQGRLGVRFRRQHPMREFVLDFYCAEARLAIEVDGSAHDKQAGYDQWRDEQLRAMGIREVRLPDTAVREDLAGSLRAIHAALDEGP